MRLSVHMLVRDVASVVGRGIRSVCRELPPDEVEVCYVDTGSTDGTPEVVERLCAELGVACRGVHVSPLTNPGLYFEDAPGSYAPYDVPDCTGGWYLDDWDHVRNMGLDLCRGQYVLKLDADDELRSQGTLTHVLEYLDQHPGLELVCSPYEVMEDAVDVEYVTLYTRLWRNSSIIRFREVCHENIDWARKVDCSNWTIAATGLRFRDWRDGPRAPYRNLKVLLHQYVWHQRTVTAPSPHLLIYLADEAADVLPELAYDLVRQLPSDLSPTDAGWSNMILARAHVALGNPALAMLAYARAKDLGYSRAELKSLLTFRHPEERKYMQRLWAAAQNNQTWKSGDLLYYPKNASGKEVREAKKILGDFDPTAPAARCRFDGCLAEARLDSTYCASHYVPQGD